jgi:hypothetical protein
VSTRVAPKKFVESLTIIFHRIMLTILQRLCRPIAGTTIAFNSTQQKRIKPNNVDPFFKAIGNFLKSPCGKILLKHADVLKTAQILDKFSLRLLTI